MDIPRWKWRNREQLLQELDARVRIKDIKAVYDLKDAIEFKWYEPLLKLLLVAAALGFALTFILMMMRGLDLFTALSEQTEQTGINRESAKMILWYIAVSFASMLVLGLLALEVMMSRVWAMRRLNQIQLRAIEILQAEVEELRAHTEAPHESPTTESEEPE